MAGGESDIAGKAIDAARDVVSEPAKATQEVAKAVQKSIDLIRDVGKVFGPVVEQFAETMTHQMMYYKFLNANRIASKVEKLRVEQKISPDAVKFVPFGMSIKLLEATSMEEDDSVQDLWARLIFNATNSQQKVDVKKVYIDLIQSLSGPEVILLDFLWMCEGRARFRSQKELSDFNREMNEIANARWRSLDIDIQQTSIQNLIRLRCIGVRPKPIDMSGALKQINFDDRRNTTVFTVDPRVFQRLITDLMDNIATTSGLLPGDSNSPIMVGTSSAFRVPFGAISVPEMNFVLTPLGNDLMRACSKPGNKEA